MRSFREFIDKKQRDNKNHLAILKKVLEQGSMKVQDHLTEDDPYIYVRGDGSMSFEGLRIYTIGDQIAYRVQKEEKTQPYGRAYLIDIEEMFNELVSDNYSSKTAAKEIIKAINEGIKDFFQKSKEAEEENRDSGIQTDTDPVGRAVIKSGGVGYSNYN